MSRDDAYFKILEATAQIQQHIALILSAKATEAEKARNWMCQHVLASSYRVDKEQLEEPHKFHDLIVETIEGITKVEMGLAENLKVLLKQNKDASGLGDFADLFDLNGEDK